MAGTINLSLSQQLDQYGEPLSGGLLYFIRAGTVRTPQNAFFDSGLTLPFPNPYTLDAAGRIPQFFLADGSIKVILTDRHGVEQINADNILVIGPSSGGGGGGGTVDPTALITTGIIVPVYGAGTLPGYVRLNGRTIGSSTSGGTERANADAQSLFELYYARDATLAVSGGRGSSAHDDWLANKTLTLPDIRGRTLAGLDDMGNTAAGRLTSAYAFGTTTTLGAVGGSEFQTLSAAQIPPVIPVFTGTAGAVNVASSIFDIVSGAPPTSNLSLTGGTSGILLQQGASSQVFSTGSFTPAGTIAPIGGGGGHANVQPTMLITFYAKL